MGARKSYEKGRVGKPAKSLSDREKHDSAWISFWLPAPEKYTPSCLQLRADTSDLYARLDEQMNGVLGVGWNFRLAS